MSVVYFLQCGDSGPIKIGRAIDVARRMEMLQTGCPYVLQLLGTLDDEEFPEHELHARFADLRLRGEWFHPAKSLLDFIERRGRAPERPVPIPEPEITNPMRRFRLEMGITQAELGKHLRMHQAHVSRAEAADCLHPRLQLALIALRDRICPESGEPESAAA